MADIAVSKHWKNGFHVGWKKYIGGRNFHLAYGTDRASREAAQRVARALFARLELKKLGGETEWNEKEVGECLALGCGRLRAAPSRWSHPLKRPRLPVDEQNPLVDAYYDDLILWLACREAKALIHFSK